jgi:hypothetical protein
MKIARYVKGLNEEDVRISYTFGSENSKTGDSIQQWVTPKDWEGDRSKQIDTKESQAVCGDCPLIKRCYVKKGYAGLGLKSTAKSTKHIEIEETKMLGAFENQFIRFGAFGEPVLVGEDVVKKIISVVKNWTGYTHQHKNPKYQWAKKYFMASCDLTDYEDAIARGWNPFIVIPRGSKPPEGAVNCPSSKEAGRKTTCAKCNLCRGTSSNAKPIWTYEH